MKVLLVIAHIAPSYGGICTMTLDFARALGQQGIEVDIATTNVDGEGCLDVPLDRWVAAASYRIRYFSCRYVANAEISGALARWLFEQVRDYDLVQTMGLFSPIVSIAHWACQRWRVPYIATPHGMLDPWALAYKAGKKKVYLAAIDRPALTRASAIYALNATESEHIRSLDFSAPTIVIPNGIHWQAFEKLPDPGEFLAKFPETRDRHRILFMARLDPKKGLDLLAPALARVRVQVPNAHLILAGSDNIGFLPQVKEYFATAGCSDGVTFTGMLTGSLKLSALAAATAFVLPSYSEGFSMSVLEAMAAGLPCTITTGCNFPEAGDAMVANVVRIEADEIASALISTCQQPQASTAMGERARAFVRERYTWEQIAAKVIDIYRPIGAGEPLILN